MEVVKKTVTAIQEAGHPVTLTVYRGHGHSYEEVRRPSSTRLHGNSRNRSNWKVLHTFSPTARAGLATCVHCSVSSP